MHHKSILKEIFAVGTLVLFMASATPASSAPIATLFGTGFTGAGVLQALGQIDGNYIVLENSGQPAEVVSQPNGLWLPNDANSQWIWQNASALPGNVTRTFRTTFALTGLDPASAVINGSWAVDNTGVDIRLNGSSTGISLPGSPFSNLDSFHPFTISSGFVTGLNTLDFIVTDLGAPGGFRAQLTGTANLAGNQVPEPGSLALFGFGLAGLRLLRRRRKAA